MELLGAIASIILFDLVLSGDNAVVIGMAAHALPPKQRRLAILIGGVAAVLLRIAASSVATVLFQLPAVKVVGGLLLAYIAFKLLEQEEEEREHVKVSVSLRGAMTTILVADFIMSLDNVLAIAAAAHGSIPLLIFGLVLSMPIVLFLGSVVASVVDRLWWIGYVGSAVIVWTGVDMALSDDLLPGVAGDLGAWHWVILVVATVGVVAASHWFHRRPSRPRGRAANRG